MTYHLDELCSPAESVPPIAVLQRHPVSLLMEMSMQEHRAVPELYTAPREERPMDVDDHGDHAREGESLDWMPVGPGCSTESGPPGGDVAEHKRAMEVPSCDRLVGDGSRRLNVDNLLRQCLHGAMALIIEPPNCPQRKTQRVDQLVQLITRQGSGGNGVCNTSARS